MRFLSTMEAKRYSISFEVFPPRTKQNSRSIEAAAYAIADLHPVFMSVTYGAGGGSGEYTADFARSLQMNKNVPVMAHLTCVNSTRDHVREQLSLLKSRGIHSVLALRGDIPNGYVPEDRHYHYAAELVRDIKEFDHDFCIAGACYPDTHPEAKSQKDDLIHIKEKVDAGLDFLITQMFFDNPMFYSYMYQLRETGIGVPVHPGVMPIVNAKQIQRVLKLSGTTLPQRFRRLLDAFGETPEAMRQAGIAYATEQIVDLFANGFSAVHVYSMNNPCVAEAIMRNLSQIVALEYGDAKWTETI